MEITVTVYIGLCDNKHPNISRKSIVTFECCVIPVYCLSQVVLYKSVCTALAAGFR